MVAPILPDDPAFPPALLHLLSANLTPCTALYTRGAWPPRPGIAVVGTRKPTPEALDFTRALAAAITGAGWAVWSGGALGIDGAAHQAALDQGGATVVVMPSGFAQPYPPQHRELFERVVAAGGTLLTPFPEHARPQVPAFHRRNAVLAALTLATVVVQAGAKSGARSTARAARRLKRPLYVVPHAPWDPNGEGCALELEAGARALAVVDTLAASLGCPRAPDPAHERARVAPMDPITIRVFDAISETPIHTDDLCDSTRLTFAAVTAALLTLTLQAVVVEAPAGFYRRRKQ